MEYPSRSNLNCFLSFNEASAKGDEHYESYNYFVDFRCKSDHYLSIPDWIRTNDPQLRRLLLYPTELRRHFCTEDGSRTHTSLTAQRILSPSCLPFHHLGKYLIPICQRPLQIYVRKSLKTKNPKIFLRCSGLTCFISFSFSYNLFNSELG